MENCCSRISGRASRPSCIAFNQSVNLTLNTPTSFIREFKGEKAFYLFLKFGFETKKKLLPQEINKYASSNKKNSAVF